MKQENKPEIITITGDNGKNLDFYLEAEIEYDGYAYQILMPTKKYDDLEEDMAIVFRVEVIDGENQYFIEENDEIISIIEEIYNEG